VLHDVLSKIVTRHSLDRIDELLSSPTSPRQTTAAAWKKKPLTYNQSQALYFTLILYFDLFYPNGPGVARAVWVQGFDLSGFSDEWLDSSTISLANITFDIFIID
jgi:hypothetical protein